MSIENMSRGSFTTIKNRDKEEIIEKKSRFIAYAGPAATDEEALSFIDEVKAKHKDATHHVYAYIAGEQDQFQRSNDDGEPSGTAGRPVLEAIKKAGLKNTAIVVVRYFGGILLGAGGLTRAYAKAANMVINKTGKVLKSPADLYSLSFDYTYLSKLEAYLSANRYPVENKIYAEKITFACLFPEEDVKRVLDRLTEITSDNIEILSLGGKAYIERDN